MTRKIFLSVIILFFLYFFIRDLNPSGARDIKYDFCRPSPYVSELSPLGRVLAIEKTEDFCYQRMVIDPVYVDVRLPQSYDAVTVSAVYKKPRSQTLSLGVRASLYEWQWKMETLISAVHNDWQTQEVHFDITALPLERRRIRFIISSPGLGDSGKEIEFRELTFKFNKQPFNLGMVKRWLKSFVR
ncbi:MAG: hypothetical protein WC659_04860 [Patescibacteria group bacterium]